MSASLIAVASALPGEKVGNEFFSSELKDNKNPMFMGTEFRHHMGRQDKASDLIADACKKIIGDLDLNPETDIDILMTNVSIPDQPFTGCGAVVSKVLGAKPKWIYDLSNTGCVSFVYMMDLAQTIMMARGARSALICCAQTAGGRIFALEGVKTKAQAAIPGDGCGVGYLVADDRAPIMATVQRSFGEFSEDMYACFDDDRKWWEPGDSNGFIDFTESKTAKIMMRGNRAVPRVVKGACEEAGIKTSDIDILITNQPNTSFLRNWREALQIPKDKHLDTFRQYANLFGAGIPVTLDEGVRIGKIKKDQVLCLAGFSHACDYAAATVLRWGE